MCASQSHSNENSWSSSCVMGSWGATNIYPFGMTIQIDSYFDGSKPATTYLYNIYIIYIYYCIHIISCTIYIYILYVYVPSFFFYVGSPKQWPTSSINMYQFSAKVWWSSSLDPDDLTIDGCLLFLDHQRSVKFGTNLETWVDIADHFLFWAVAGDFGFYGSVQREFETSWVRLFWFQAVTWMLALDSSLSCTRDSLSTWGFFVDMAEMIVTIFLNASSCNPLDRRQRPETQHN